LAASACDDHDDPAQVPVAGWQLDDHYHHVTMITVTVTVPVTARQFPANVLLQ
jgi:hypothetical protein